MNKSIENKIIMSQNCHFDLIVVTGPTATGKTRLAALLADMYNGEIISADSRQIYRKMDIGTGKDLNDYIVNGKKIPYHLIDIRDAGYEYNVFEFQRDFLKSFQLIKERQKQPILSGGTGFYIESALSGEKIIEVHKNHDLREKIEKLSYQELMHMLSSMKSLHNTTDIDDRDRLIRAIEIEKHKNDNRELIEDFPEFSFIIFAIHFERNVLRDRITERLNKRLEEGMIEEVDDLIKSGVKPEQLKYYGLEYRFVTDYLTGEIDHDKMIEMLNTAIHQFAKRQMTWYRRMERQNYKIHWIDGQKSDEEKLKEMSEITENPTVKQKTK